MLDLIIIRLFSLVPLYIGWMLLRRVDLELASLCSVGFHRKTLFPGMLLFVRVPIECLLGLARL